MHSHTYDLCRVAVPGMHGTIRNLSEARNILRWSTLEPEFRSLSPDLVESATTHLWRHTTSRLFWLVRAEDPITCASACQDRPSGARLRPKDAPLGAWLHQSWRTRCGAGSREWRGMCSKQTGRASGAGLWELRCKNWAIVSIMSWT